MTRNSDILQLPPRTTLRPRSRSYDCSARNRRPTTSKETVTMHPQRTTYHGRGAPQRNSQFGRLAPSSPLGWCPPVFGMVPTFSFASSGAYSWPDSSGVRDHKDLRHLQASAPRNLGKEKTRSHQNPKRHDTPGWSKGRASTNAPTENPSTHPARRESRTSSTSTRRRPHRARRKEKPTVCFTSPWVGAMAVSMLRRLVWRVPPVTGLLPCSCALLDQDGSVGGLPVRRLVPSIPWVGALLP